MEENWNMVNGDEDKQMIERERKKKAMNEEERKEENTECNRERNGRIQKKDKRVNERVR